MYSLWARIRQLILPSTALPDEPAIILGPDLPPCMQARYSAALFFRPPNTVTSGVHGGMWRFIAQRKASANTEEGYLLYDQTSICGFVVSHVLLGANDTFGNIGVLEQFTPQFAAGSSAYVANAFKWQIIGNAGSGISAAMLFGDPGTDPNLTPFLIDGVAAARGLRARVSSTAPTAAIGAEAVILTTPAMTFYDQRAYEVKWRGAVVSTVLNITTLTVRRTNLAGAIKSTTPWTITAATNYKLDDVFYIRNTSGAAVTDNLVLTMTASAGTTTMSGATTDVRYLEVRDCGASSDYSNAIAI